MKTLEGYGEAMLLANEGNTRLASMLAEAFKRWSGGLRGWLHAMPANVPPTQPF